jgi:hypothetical protein
VRRFLFIFISASSFLMLVAALIAWPVSFHDPRRGIRWVSTPRDISPAESRKYIIYMSEGKMWVMRITSCSGVHGQPSDVAYSFFKNNPVHVGPYGLSTSHIDSFGSPQDSFVTCLFVPIWFIAVIALFVPATWVISRLQRRRVPPGHCPTCRYDLRAHAPGQKCPECGTVIQTPPAVVKSHS